MVRLKEPMAIEKEIVTLSLIIMVKVENYPKGNSSSQQTQFKQFIHSSKDFTNISGAYNFLM